MQMQLCLCKAIVLDYILIIDTPFLVFWDDLPLQHSLFAV